MKTRLMVKAETGVDWDFRLEVVFAVERDLGVRKMVQKRQKAL